MTRTFKKEKHESLLEHASMACAVVRKTKMACSKMISFAEIVQGRDSSVRVTDDNLLYAVDLAMVGTGHSRDRAGQVSCHFQALSRFFLDSGL
jgi:hypothetical protein